MTNVIEALPMLWDWTWRTSLQVCVLICVIRLVQLPSRTATPKPRGLSKSPQTPKEPPPCQIHPIPTRISIHAIVHPPTTQHPDQIPSNTPIGPCICANSYP
jgi:hypothetical protein